MVNFVKTDDPLYLDRLRPEERIFADEVLRALPGHEKDLPDED